MNDFTTQFTPEELNTEEWRDIPGYEGCYQVSDLGRVRNVARLVPHGRHHKGQMRFAAGRILRQSVASTGYPVVAFHGTRKHKKWEVHALVALAFLGPRPPHTHIHHVSHDKLDNRLKNLVHLSHSDHMRLHNRKGQKLDPDKVREIRRLLADGCTQVNIAARFGVAQTQISCIKLGKTWEYIT